MSEIRLYYYLAIEQFRQVTQCEVIVIYIRPIIVSLCYNLNSSFREIKHICGPFFAAEFPSSCGVGEIMIHIWNDWPSWNKISRNKGIGITRPAKIFKAKDKYIFSWPWLYLLVFNLTEIEISY